MLVDVANAIVITFSLRQWQDRLFRGHVSIGPVTIFGANAMYWAVNVQFRGTYWCFHPRTRTYGGLWRALLLRKQGRHTNGGHV